MFWLLKIKMVINIKILNIIFLIGLADLLIICILYLYFCFFLMLGKIQKKLIIQKISLHQILKVFRFCETLSNKKL
jgi:hypothetical protein